MLVDNPLGSNFSYQSTFEEFLNMDLLAGPSNTIPGDSSSRSSSNSPSNTFSALPPTPPNPFTTPDAANNTFFNFLDDDFGVNTKVDPFAPPPTTAAPFDFFGAFPSPASLLQDSSPESGMGSSSTSSSSGSSKDSPVVAIDPQLVGTPTQSKATSEFDEDEELEEDDEQEEYQNPFSPESPATDEVSITPVKVGGRGKAAGRKGTVQSGGVVKKTGGSDKKENQPAAMWTTTSTEPDDWRPSPEEYKKMSSKEKRQLRNKISARNFRVRRKEYITNLEGHLAERDSIIDQIRTELMGTKSENSALRQEVAALKKALLEGRGQPNMPVLPPPAPLSSVLASPPASPKSLAPTPRSPLLLPNTQKDLPTSPRLGGQSWWAGSSNPLGMGLGGYATVHTTLVPEWSSILAGKPLAGNGNAEHQTPALQENLNPMLNGASANTAVGGFGMGGQKGQKDVQLPLSGFDSFADKNLFTLKSMEDFRMQLWTRMGQQQALHRQQQQQQMQQQQQQDSAAGLNGLASNLRPHFFAPKQSPTLSALLSGKPSTAASSYPTPPSSPSISHASIPTSQSQYRHPTPMEQQAMLASIASQTLVRKLGSAFWDAFSGGSSSSGGVKKDWDADKVRRVLEGKAVVQVVDVEPTPQPFPAPASSKLSERLAGPSSPRLAAARANERKGSCKGCISSILEDGIRNMHL